MANGLIQKKVNNKTLEEKVKETQEVSQTLISLCQVIRKSYAILCFQILKKTFKDYTEDELFISFNGGKDCTVLLHLVMSLLNNEKPLHCLYVQPEQPFDEIEEFVKSCELEYHIKIDTIKGNIKNVLEKVCEENPSLKACIMGSRRTDPYCGNLKSFHETDPGWPKLMRVNPMLDWNCEDVWEYLKENNVPYCKLYLSGYTSLGDKTNTIPNPHLKFIDSKTGNYFYKPACDLKNSDEWERAGRL